jgi:hypothetical protein
MTLSAPSFNPVKAAIALGLCLALGPTLAGYFIYSGIVEAKLGDRYVTAKGLVERVEKSDRGTFELTFKVTGNDLGQAYQKLNQNTALAKTFIVNAGFTEADITILAPQVSDLHARDYGENTPPERYLLERTIAVNSKNVDLLNTFSGKTGELIEQGVTVNRGYIQFYLDKFNELRPGLVSEATKNAFEVAKSFAVETGSEIGKIRKANQGVITLTSPNAPPGQDYDNGTSSLFKKIRVVTTIEFYLK